MKTLKLYNNIASALTLENVIAKDGKHLTPSDLGIKKNISLLCSKEKIEWLGPKNKLPSKYFKTIQKEIDLEGKLVTPGLIDSHTHLVFSGNRANEYVMRLCGATYQEIATNGGGIAASSKATNADNANNLTTLATKRLNAMEKLGIVACEIKSGYALTLDGELKLLQVINKLKDLFKNKIKIHRTLMSAHAIPKNISLDNYLKKVVFPSIEQASKLKLADSVDIFHEVGYFDTPAVEKIFKFSKKLGLSLKLHVDEFNNNHGAALGAKHHCLSVDHLLNTDVNGAQLLAKTNTVATLLPGTAFFLGKKLANAKMLLEAGCKVAIASDFNPGSCYMNDVFQIARLSSPSLGLHPANMWCAITYNAAQAINLKNYGAIVPGYSSKLLVWDAATQEDLLYDWTQRPKCQLL